MRCRVAPTFLHAAVLMVDAASPDGSNRRRVYDLVARHPGLHQRDIARRLDLHPNNAAHHLRHLARAGLLSAQREGGYLRYYVRVQGTTATAGAVGHHERQQLGILRQVRALEIVARLLTEGPVRMGALAETLRISPATLTHHADRLEEAGIVQREQEGRTRILRLADREATIRLLLAHEPPADLVAGFQNLWEEVGF